MGHWTFALAFTLTGVLVVACGDDDDGSAATCTTDCDGGIRDSAITTGGGGSRADAGGQGGTSATGKGGSGGTAPAADASSGDPDPGGSDGGSSDGSVPGSPGDRDANVEPDPLPMTGDQLSVCGAPADCDMNFGCYDVGPGRGFCTAVCENDNDCKEIDGADYSCSADGLCEVECGGGPRGSERCPEGLVCTQVTDTGPGGLRNRCKYPASPGADGGP
jgi:hypothetical protein